MLKKVIKLVTNNLGLKIMALLSAVILWIVVININDPTQTKKFEITVSLENGDTISNMGKYYEVAGETATIEFQISATRSMLRVLNSTDFKAVADLSRVEDLNGQPRVPIEITPLRYQGLIKVLTKTQYLKLYVEDMANERFIITPECTGTPAENYALGNVDVIGANLLYVSGPKSIISRIAAAKAPIEIDGMSSSFTGKAITTLYDADGNIIETDKLELSNGAVNISVEILDVKMVEIRAEVTGTAADGYVNTGIQYSPQTVAVKGEASTLNELNAIVIPEGIINIDGLTDSMTQTVDFASYLPDNVTLVDSEAKKVDVTVTIEKIGTMVYEIPTDDIVIKNLSKGYDVEYLNDTITISVQGLESNLAALTTADISLTLDLSGLKVGEHTVTLMIAMNEELYTFDAEQSVIVTLIPKLDDENGDGGGDNTAAENDDSNTNNSNTNNNTNKNNKKNDTDKNNTDNNKNKTDDDATNKVEEDTE